MSIKKLLLGMPLLLTLASAHAVPLTFTDEATFLGAAGSLSMESFEGEVATNNRLLGNLSLTDFNMTMSGGDTLGVFDVTDYFGGHATDGVNYVGFSDGHAYVDLAFNSSIDSFGINLTDFGDFGNGTVTFSNNLGDVYTAAVTGLGNGNEQFFGIITDFNFTSVRLSQNIAGEFYAVDEIYYGIASVPEPSIILLLASGLAILGLLRRRTS